MLRYAESLNERGLLQRAESLKSDAEGCACVCATASAA